MTYGECCLFVLQVTLLTEMARIHEGINDLKSSLYYYKLIAEQDASNIEAIASIGLNYFYDFQPEVALRYYKYVYFIY